MRRLRALALALACSGASSPGVAAEDAPPGQLVDVGSHKMHIQCVGSGGPTVVMDAGLGGTALDWSRVQPLVAGFTRVCAYDRSGYGWSEASPTPRSSLHIAEELHALLDESGVEPPFVLVAHSFGGFNVRLFAARYPAEVVGMVLIDASHEGQFERFESQFGVSLAPKRRGLMRLSPPRVHEAIPDALRPVAQRRAARPTAMMAVRDELMNFRLSAQQVAEHTGLPDVPLTVITRGLQQWRDVARAAEMEQTWVELQHALAGLTSDRRHIIAERSGHYVHLEQPALVSEAIRGHIRRLREAQTFREMLADHGARLY